MADMTDKVWRTRYDGLYRQCIMDMIVVHYQSCLSCIVCQSVIVSHSLSIMSVIHCQSLSARCPPLSHLPVPIFRLATLAKRVPEIVKKVTTQPSPISPYLQCHPKPSVTITPSCIPTLISPIPIPPLTYPSPNPPYLSSLSLSYPSSYLL